MNSNNRLYAWLNLRPGEEKSASLMLLHSFFMGISTVFFETAASALFLAQFEATSLPFVYLAAAAVSISTGLTYTRLKDRLAFTPLMVGTLGLLFVLVCLMRLGLSVFQASWLVFSMMVAYRLISILTDLEFWAVAARLYDVQQSKRLFSLIGSGEVTARILGAFSVPLLVRWLGVAPCQDPPCSRLTGRRASGTLRPYAGVRLGRPLRSPPGFVYLGALRFLSPCLSFASRTSASSSAPSSAAKGWAGR